MAMDIVKEPVVNLSVPSGVEVNSGEGVISEDTSNDVGEPSEEIDSGETKPAKDFDIDELTGDGDKGVEDPAAEASNGKGGKSIIDKEKDGRDKEVKDKEPDKDEPETKDEVDEDDEPDEKEPAPKKGRDYTNLPPQVVKALKSMNNAQYSKVAPAVRAIYDEAVKAIATATEIKKAAEAKGPPPSWYDNPNAYQLSDEYQSATRELNMVDREARFYQQQLIAIKSGNEFRIITGYDEQGNPLLSQPQKPTNEAEVLITDGLNDLRGMRDKHRGAIGELQKNFKDRYTRTAGAVKQQVDTCINNLEEGLRPDAEKVKLMMDVIDPVHRSHPLAYGYGQMFGVLLKQAAEIQRLRGVKTTEARVNNDRRRAGPAVDKLTKTSSEATNGTVKIKGKVHPKMFDIDELTE